MKAVQIISPGNIEVTEKEKPTVKNGEILLKINYIGFCGSDLSTYLGKNPLVEYPKIPGHEISSTIEETGSDVPEKYQKGLKATVVPYTNCGQCSACKQKRFNACRYNQTLGVQRNGAMAEYIAIPWEKVIVDNQLNDVQLALVEPLTVGFHAIDNASVTDLDTVLVLGCGMIGAGAIIRAQLRGATVIAADIDDDKLALTKKMGAQHTINTQKSDLHKELSEITNDNGPSVVVEAAGNPVTYKAAMAEVGFAGRVVCIGYAGNEVELSTKLWVQKELQIFGSRNANPSDFEAVLKYLKSGQIDEKLLISKIIKPEDAATEVQNWADAPGKVMKILVAF